ncbi:hypothetical protein NIES4071_33870 [Calothrix sp. NIES-4071]|nr:hypothetical protein NIES4071_33870 [Calothrix sp. NIES-4071]BAZ57706.1 hypothetical protein NIES4105_33800 [Calothrix sp. NIES-4105]
MSDDWDISIYNRHRQLVLAAEVKVGLNAPVEWAAEFRRNIFSHGLYAPMPYFMFIFPDKIYMWTDPSSSDKITLPDYTIDAYPIFGNYYERAGIDPNEIGYFSLEFIVSTWLGRIINFSNSPDDLDEHHQWMIESGLYNAISGGYLSLEAVA